jgi:hypothetical protein
MPKGVEHAVITTGQHPKALANGSVMPKGVEHSYLPEPQEFELAPWKGRAVSVPWTARPEFQFGASNAQWSALNRPRRSPMSPMGSARLIFRLCREIEPNNSPLVRCCRRKGRRIETLGTEVRFRDGFPQFAVNHHARYDIVGTAP